MGMLTSLLVEDTFLIQLVDSDFTAGVYDPVILQHDSYVNYFIVVIFKKSKVTCFDIFKGNFFTLTSLFSSIAKQFDPAKLEYHLRKT